MSDLQQQIKQRAKFRAEDDLLRQMGYAKPGRRHRERLAMVLADPALGLGTPMYDFVHGRRDFLRALCRALRIPEHSCRAFIAERDALEVENAMLAGFTPSQRRQFAKSLQRCVTQLGGGLGTTGRR